MDNKNKKRICKQCTNEFVNENPRANNVRFCSPECREKYYYLNYRKQYAIDKRGAFAPNKIQCLVCKKWYVQICTHVLQVHDMTAREYKKEYGYDLKRGLIPEHYREVKRETQDPKTLENLKVGRKFWFKKGDKKAGKYERSEQTKNRLRKQGKWLAEKYPIRGKGSYPQQ